MGCLLVGYVGAGNVGNVDECLVLVDVLSSLHHSKNDGVSTCFGSPSSSSPFVLPGTMRLSSLFDRGTCGKSQLGV